MEMILKIRTNFPRKTICFQQIHDKSIFRVWNSDISSDVCAPIQRRKMKTTLSYCRRIGWMVNEKRELNILRLTQSPFICYEYCIPIDDKIQIFMSKKIQSCCVPCLCVNRKTARVVDIFRECTCLYTGSRAKCIFNRGVPV